MKNLKTKSKNKLMVVFLIISMAIIISLWFAFSPPSYFEKSDGPEVFDTIKSQFSDVF
ncbi:MAG: hypothetical protein ACI88L_000605 [Candidatus Paceibacteria bacterium]|jgi:hypothetical protein